GAFADAGVAAGALFLAPGAGGAGWAEAPRLRAHIRANTGTGNIAGDLAGVKPRFWHRVDERSRTGAWRDIARPGTSGPNRLARHRRAARQCAINALDMWHPPSMAEHRRRRRTLPGHPWPGVRPFAACRK